MFYIRRKSLILRNGVEKIEAYAFYQSEITEINLPDSLKEMGEYAFYECKKLEKVNLGKNLEIIPDYAFEKCSKIQSIAIPEKVSKIGKYAFEGCSLTSITIPKACTEIGEYAFFQNCLKEAVIRGKISTLYRGTFYYNSSLYKLSIPSTLSVIREGALL